MPVTDDQVAALRAQLAGDLEEHKRLLGQMDREQAATGYTALLAAAFFEATDHRFVKNGKVADDTEVIDFVAAVRARTATAAEEINPLIAERLLMHALGKGSISDIESRVRVRTQILLLAGLISDADLSVAQLDEFMTQVRALAEEWAS